LIAIRRGLSIALLLVWRIAVGRARRRGAVLPRRAWRRTAELPGGTRRRGVAPVSLLLRRIVSAWRTWRRAAVAGLLWIGRMPLRISRRRRTSCGMLAALFEMGPRDKHTRGTIIRHGSGESVTLEQEKITMNGGRKEIEVEENAVETITQSRTSASVLFVHRLL
jgi:hypothetical protein